MSRSRTTIIFIAILLFLGGWFTVQNFFISKSDDSLTALETAIRDYLTENINQLSPQPAVLGGRFYLTDLVLLDNRTGRVSYEDGHLAYQAEFFFTISPTGSVLIDEFKIVDE